MILSDVIYKEISFSLESVAPCEIAAYFSIFSVICYNFSEILG